MKREIKFRGKSTDTGNGYMDFSLFSILPEGTKTDLSSQTRQRYILRKTAGAMTYGLKLLVSSPAYVIRTVKKYTKVILLNATEIYARLCTVIIMPDLRLIKKVGYISTSLEKHLVIKIVLLLATYTITLSY